jgi:hypothetical protein
MANTEKVRPIQTPVAPRSSAKTGSSGLTIEMPMEATSDVK